jgi:hypothetical protein
VSNSLGVSIALTVGTRLLTAPRAVAYSDPLGTVSQGSALLADTDGNVAAYVARKRFDHLVGTAPAVGFDAATSAQLEEGELLTWSHTASGSGRYVVVVVCFSPVGGEGVQSVTYGGQAMTLLARSGKTEVYRLANPPTGSQTIAVQFTSGSSVNAVGGAVSVTGVDAAAPVGLLRTASGTGTAASASFPFVMRGSLVVDTIGVSNASASVTATAGSGQTQRWNRLVGVGAQTTRCAGSTRPWAADPYSTSWTLSNSQSWELIAVELRPPQRLAIDTEAGIVPDPTWVNARNYASLQAAVDAAPTGGSVFIPAGTYTVPSGGLVIRKPVAVFGEYGTRLLSNSVATNQPVIKIDPQAAVLDGVQLRDLELNQVQSPTGFLAGNYGIQCDIDQIGGKVTALLIERVRVANMGDHGIHLDGQGTNDRVFVFVTLRNVQSSTCRGMGLNVRFANSLTVQNSYFSSNHDNGVKVESVTAYFQGCGFQNNCLSSAVHPVEGGQVFVRSCAISRFVACEFEQFTEDPDPPTQLRSNRRGLTILNSPCCTVDSSAFFNEAEHSDVGQRGIYCTYGDDPGPTGVAACVIFPCRFDNVKTAIEIDGTEFITRDCAVFPQFIGSGTGDILVPWGVQNSGMVTLGKRYTVSGSGASLMRSAPFLPVVTTQQRPTPPLGQEAAQVGLVVFNSDVQTLQMWNGTAWQAI